MFYKCKNEMHTFQMAINFYPRMVVADTLYRLQLMEICQQLLVIVKNQLDLQDYLSEWHKWALEHITV